MPVWSVSIVPGAHANDPDVFVAQNQDTAPPGTLYADAGDAVSWNNTTTRDHQPVQTGPDGKILDPMPAGGLSCDVVTPDHQTDAWLVTGNITYICKIHRDEKGIVSVS